ncbi:MAG: response regulator transcription factor [Bacteroidota bacterium]
MNESKAHKILVVDDERDLCEILEFNLTSEGFRVETAHSAEVALKKPLESFDLILLDVMMGNTSGYRMASIMRNEMKLNVPIIFLTAKNTENDILTGFTVGADDYIPKPFSIKEMLARVRAVLKRGKALAVENELLSSDELLVNTNNKTVHIGERQVNLTRKEFEILAMLMTQKGHFFSREEILNRIWSDDVIVTQRNVDVNIARLRKKVGNYGRCIQGRSGYGYCFMDKHLVKQ